MVTIKMAVIAGDGVGPEVIREGIRVLDAVARLDGSFAFEWTHFPWGCDYYLKTGRMMPEDGIETHRPLVSFTNSESEFAYLSAQAYAENIIQHSV